MYLFNIGELTDEAWGAGAEDLLYPLRNREGALDSQREEAWDEARIVPRFSEEEDSISSAAAVVLLRELVSDRVVRVFFSRYDQDYQLLITRYESDLPAIVEDGRLDDAFELACLWAGSPACWEALGTMGWPLASASPEGTVAEEGVEATSTWRRVMVRGPHELWELETVDWVEAPMWRDLTWKGLGSDGQHTVVAKLMEDDRVPTSICACLMDIHPGTREDTRSLLTESALMERTATFTTPGTAVGTWYNWRSEDGA